MVIVWIIIRVTIILIINNSIDTNDNKYKDKKYNDYDNGNDTNKKYCFHDNNDSNNSNKDNVDNDDSDDDDSNTTKLVVVILVAVVVTTVAVAKRALKTRTWQQ